MPKHGTWERISGAWYKEHPYGKDQKEVRRSIQDNRGSGDPVWGPNSERHLPGAPASEADRGAMDRALLGGRARGEAVSAREDAGKGGRQTEIQDRGSCDADRSFKKIPSGAGAEEKRQFIRDNREKFGSVPRACKAVGLSVSTFYYKLKIDPIQRQKKDAEVRDLIEQVQTEFPAYGYRRVHEYLEKALGITINQKKIRRIMDESDHQRNGPNFSHFFS